MKKLVLLAIAFCFCMPVLFAVNDDGSASSQGQAKTLTVATKAPGQLTTLFASNNGFRGNMFDIEPITDITEITAIDVNVDPAGLATNVDVWYRMDTCVGHDLSPTGWMLLGSGTGTAAGVDLPTFIDLAGNGVSFAAGGTYGMYVDITNYPSPGMNYTNAPGPQNYSNAELSLTTYYGKGDPAFTGSTFSTREWNGTVYYEAGAPAALGVNPKEVSAFLGGTFNFDLFGDGLGGRDYVLLGGASGSTPGTVLPGGLVLGINWDFFTDLLLELALAGGYGLVNDFIGTLDVDGNATASLVFPGHCQLFEDLDLCFAWCTYNPFDFVSNTVKVKLLGAVLPPEGYFYDDGTSENALGWTAGGVAVWIHSFDSGTGDTIDEVSSCFGQDGSASGPPNGDPIDVWVWSDPNQDGEPSDGLLLGQGSGVVANTSTNDFNHYALDVPTAVNGKFFVGCGLDTLAGTFAAPMDTGSSLGVAFFTGAFVGSGLVWDPNNLPGGGFVFYEMSSIGFPCVWMLRANDN